MALKPVGSGVSFAISGTAAASAFISHQSEYLRVYSPDKDAHVAVGTNPTAGTGDLVVAGGASGAEVISIGRPSSQRVAGVTTGTTTIIDFPEGTGQPFEVGDAVTLTGVPSYLTFTHKIVDSVNTTAGVDGYFNTRIIVNHDSSGIHTNYVAQTPGPDYAELRGSFMVAGYGDGSGTLHYQQVQRI